MNDINKDIGHRIKRLREEAGLNQSGLGVHLGVGKTMVSKYEAGAAKVTPEALLTLSNLFNVSLDYLLSGASRPVSPLPPSKEDALRLILTSDTSLVEHIKAYFRSQAHEEMGNYSSLTNEEHRLIEAYHCASEEIREEALGMLVRSAERSGGRGGG